MKKVLLLILSLYSSVSFYAQTISMDFPKFAGKNYTFTIFQGSKVITAHEGIIPQNGKFNMEIPAQFSPYKGMFRWQISNSDGGGQLDMIIPGYGYSISCLEEAPSEANIIYNGYNPNHTLNVLVNEQAAIIEKYNIMLKAMKIYDKNHKLYKLFKEEQNIQAKSYDDFYKKISKNDNYESKLLPILGIRNGKGIKFLEDDTQNYKEIAKYITNDLDIDALYTSGHWDAIIEIWVQIQKELIKDDHIFYTDFNKLTNRIHDPKIYTEFTEKVTAFLQANGMDSQIAVITPIVINSKKVTNYSGNLIVYQKKIIGIQAPDIVVTEHIGPVLDHNHKTKILKSKDLATEGYKKTAVIFYLSGCGPCENLMQQLPENYKLLMDMGVRIISISADTDPEVFRSSSSQYPWTDKYCDFEGIKGVNFINYAVSGTPTIFLIDKEGKVENKMSSLDELLDKLK